MDTFDFVPTTSEDNLLKSLNQVKSLFPVFLSKDADSIWCAFREKGAPFVRPAFPK